MFLSPEEALLFALSISKQVWAFKKKKKKKEKS